MISPGASVDVLVVVVTYNSADVVSGLLDGLPQALDGCSWRLVVADNDSRDTTIDVVRSALPGATVVEMRRNAGYAAGINAALAAGGPCGSALILNPDTRLAAGSVRHMFDVLQRPGIGLVVPRLMNSRHELIPSLRREPTLARAVGDTLLSARRAGRFDRWGETVTDPGRYDIETTSDWAAGSVLLISRACLDACGPWDESFFLYSEETEFCLRARDRGYRLILTPRVEAIHLEGESTVSPRLQALLTANRVRLYARSHGRLAALAFRLAEVARETSRLALRRQTSTLPLATLLSPRRARRVIPDAQGLTPDLRRRRELMVSVERHDHDRKG